jgi:acyl dehydratase
MESEAVKVFEGIDELAAAVGADLGTSGWVMVDQDRIDRFAEATGDRQWIHVDPERAKHGPFGSTIAHGFLTLSLLPVMWHELYEVRGVKHALNYGLDRVRFLSPVRAGSKIRGSAKVVDVTRLEGAVQVVVSTNVEIDGSERPAAVVESIVRYVA